MFKLTDFVISTFIESYRKESILNIRILCKLPVTHAIELHHILFMKEIIFSNSHQERLCQLKFSPFEEISVL